MLTTAVFFWLSIHEYNYYHLFCWQSKAVITKKALVFKPIVKWFLSVELNRIRIIFFFFVWQNCVSPLPTYLYFMQTIEPWMWMCIVGKLCANAHYRASLFVWFLMVKNEQNGCCKGYYQFISKKIIVCQESISQHYTLFLLSFFSTRFLGCYQMMFQNVEDNNVEVVIKRSKHF